MGAKKILPAYHLISNGDMSTTITSNITNIQNLDNIGIEWSWTGTPTGAFTILASISGQNFIPLTFSDPLPIPSGSAGLWLTDLGQVSFYQIQIVYTPTSGAGTLNVWISGKDLN